MARMCPNCNSTRLTKEGWKKLKDGNKQRWRCKVCNNLFYKPKWTRGKKKDASKQPHIKLDDTDCSLYFKNGKITKVSKDGSTVVEDNDGEV